jgi:cytosine/adenosine deaminase-related metal-dependent hydrolase
MVNAHTHIYSGLAALIVPRVPRVPRVPGVPSVPSVPKVPGVLSVPDMPVGTSGASGTPGTSGTSGTPGTLGTPGTSGTLGTPGTFLNTLQNVWWRLDRALDARSLRAAARFYVADALAHGTGALIDHHESPEFIDGSLDVLADACQELGMPAVLCYGATERNGGRAEAQRGLAECRRFIRSNRRPFVRGVVGLHASFTVSDDTIRDAADLCRECGTVLHVHVAEDQVDVEDARTRGYAGPLERLEALGALVPGSILAHGVHLDVRHMNLAAARGCWIVQNPRSNRQNGVGYPMAIRCAARVALGTDGFPADMRAELEALRVIGAEHGEDVAGLDARLGNGVTLARERFGGSLPAAGPAPLPQMMDGIRAAAQEEAQRLSARMG